MNLIVAGCSVFILNIPFGYWRDNVRKFSLQWILAIHLAVPLVIAIRYLSGLGFQLYTYPVLVGAFFTGQLYGSRLHRRWKRNFENVISSCLVYDIYRKVNKSSESE